MRLKLARPTRIRDHKLSKARLFAGATPFRLLTATAAVFATVALLGGVLAPRGEAAATISAELVKDINPSGGSSPNYLAVFDGSLYFAADDGSNGIELWKSDGTAAGTAMLKDINPTGDSNPGSFAVFNGSLYFGADDGVLGFNLWKTDGTSGGTTMVKDINPTGGSTAYFLTVFNGSLYFAADDGTHGQELWKSDGTGTGTAMLKDINPTGVSSTAYLTVFNGSLYFAATDGVNGQELWKSDGTSIGTTMLKDINPTGDSNPGSFAVFNGSLYFGANDGVHGAELWKSDGTGAGTTMVADINPSASGDPFYLTVFKSNLYFEANDGVHGYELWRAGDFSPPETQIDSGPSGTITSSSASFSFSADEASTFQCALDGAAMSACTSPKALSGLANGSHSFQVRATDLVGNVDASPASRTFTVAAVTTTTTTTTTTPPPPPPYPQTRIAKHPKKVVSTRGRTARAAFKFTSSKKGSRFSCKLDKGKWASCRSPKSYKVKPGKHTFRVRATYAGRTDRTPASWTWTVKRR